MHQTSSILHHIIAHNSNNEASMHKIGSTLHPSNKKKSRERPENGTLPPVMIYTIQLRSNIIAHNSNNEAGYAQSWLNTSPFNKKKQRKTGEWHLDTCYDLHTGTLPPVMIYTIQLRSNIIAHNSNNEAGMHQIDSTPHPSNKKKQRKTGEHQL